MKSFLKLASMMIIAGGVMLNADGMQNQTNAGGVTLNVKGIEVQIKGVKVIDNELEGKQRKTIIVDSNFFDQKICKGEPGDVPPPLNPEDPTPYVIQKLIWLYQVYSRMDNMSDEEARKSAISCVELFVSRTINAPVYGIYYNTNQIDNSSH